MQLIVAEKPSVARDLARVLGVRPQGQHAFEGQAVITWCVGHLVELDEPAAYDGRWKAWRLDTLPMLPDAFRLRAAKHAAAQLRAVARLMTERRFTTIVNACDAGREGELIFGYVYQFAGARLPVRRLWVSSLTDDAIRRGFAALRPPQTALADAARSRSEADWLVGMNATRAVTVRAGRSGLFSIGRVQTPTLAMLVAREHAIAAFVPQPYWEVRGKFPGFTALWRHGKVGRVTEPVASAIVARDRGAPACVERVSGKTVREPPPLLFDLTSLQRTANKRFKLSAARTLEIAQALYERHKVLTYPRTDSRYLSTDVAAELRGRFEALAAVPAYAPFAGALVADPPRPGKRIVDDAKVHDHHAIIPTGRIVALDRDEQRIFDLVARRFLAAFFPDAELAVTEAWIRVGAPGPVPQGGDPDAILAALPPPPDRYLARGRVRLVAGWQVVAGIEEDGDALPPLVEGQALAGSYEATGKQTQPPARFTDATLLAAMESAGKEVTDDVLRAAMKDCGLGTPATRASIIETLLQRDYVARDKQVLVATPTGIALIDALPVASLASPELTGAWEARLAAIARGADSRDAFMADIRRYVTEIVGAIRAAPPPSAPPAPPVGACPTCRGEVSPRRNAFACACGFEIRDRIAGRVLSPALVAVLLRHGSTQVLRGFRSKAGKKFAARLVLEGGEVRFAFDSAGDKPVAGRSPRRARAPAGSARTRIEALACPRCKAGTMIAGARGWGCTRWREGCRFVIWFETGGQRVTPAQLAALVTKGKTRKGRGGRLVLDVGADGGAARVEP